MLCIYISHEKKAKNDYLVTHITPKSLLSVIEISHIHVLHKQTAAIDFKCRRSFGCVIRTIYVIIACSSNGYTVLQSSIYIYIYIIRKMYLVIKYLKRINSTLYRDSTTSCAVNLVGSGFEEMISYNKFSSNWMHIRHYFLPNICKPVLKLRYMSHFVSARINITAAQKGFPLGFDHTVMIGTKREAPK